MTLTIIMTLLASFTLLIAEGIFYWNTNFKLMTVHSLLFLFLLLTLLYSVRTILTLVCKHNMLIHTKLISFRIISRALYSALTQLPLTFWAPHLLQLSIAITGSVNLNKKRCLTKDLATLSYTIHNARHN